MSMNVSFSDIPNPQNVPILPNRFKQRSAFVKDADGFFQCRLCDQKYKCSSSISRHNRTVHLEKLKYQCKGCSKKFYETRSWIRHLDTYTHLSGEMFCSQLQTKNSNNKDSKVKSRQKETKEKLTNGDDFGGELCDDTSDLSNRREPTKLNQPTNPQKSSMDWLLFQTKVQLEDHSSEKPYNRLPNPSNTALCDQDLVYDQFGLDQFQIKAEQEQTPDLPIYHESREDKFLINAEVKMEEQNQVEVTYVEGLFYCGACSFKTSNESVIVNHAQSVHLICECKGECHCDKAASSSKIPKATTLNDGMPSEANLPNEPNKSPERDFMPKPAKTFSCNCCTYSSEVASNLKRHVKAIHNSNCHSFPSKQKMEQKEPLVDDGQMQTDKNKTKDLTHEESAMVEITLQHEEFYCSACNHKSKELSEVKHHIIKQHRVKPKSFPCTSCGKITWDKLTMTKHMKNCPGDFLTHVSFDGEAFRCAICHHKTKIKSHAVEHVRCVHFKIRRHKCQNCNKSCSSKANLMRHFGSCQALTNVVKSDEKVENTKLESVDATKVKTDDQINKLAPIAKHSLDVPETVSIGKHLNAMKEDLSAKDIALDFDGVYFFCPHCNDKFPVKYKSHLIRHIRTVHYKQRDFECQNCHKKYFDKRTLLGHVKKFRNKSGILTCQAKTFNTDNRELLETELAKSNDVKQNLMPIAASINETRPAGMVEATQEKTMHRCAICFIKFRSESTLISHHRAVHSTQRENSFESHQEQSVLPNRYPQKDRSEKNGEKMPETGIGLTKIKMPFYNSFSDKFSKSFAQHSLTKELFCLICKFVTKTVEEVKTHFQVEHCTLAKRLLPVKDAKCPYCGEMILIGYVSHHIKKVHLHHKDFVSTNTSVNNRSPLSKTVVNDSNCNSRLIEKTDSTLKSEPNHSTNLMPSIKSSQKNDILISHHFDAKVCNAKNQPEETLKCSLCDFEAVDCKLFYIHLIKCYSGQILQNSSKQRTIIFKCKVCERSLQGKDNFSRHVRIIHEQISHKRCSNCNRAFFDNREQSSHNKKYLTDDSTMMTCNNYDYTCKGCRREFKTESLCLYHMKVCQYKGNQDRFEAPKET